MQVGGVSDVHRRCADFNTFVLWISDFSLTLFMLK